MLKNTSVYHVTRTSVTWRGESLINVELLLLRRATDIGEYQHYYLISGADLLIKKQSQIKAFLRLMWIKSLTMTRMRLYA